jgi:predicted O-methyltransferase YrrM
MSQNAFPNWFELDAVRYFEKHLTHLKDQPNLLFLQLGAYTGDASVWLVQNILTGKNCKLIDIDTWDSSNEAIYTTFDWNDLKEVYKEKTAFTDIITAHQMTTTEFLKGCTDTFDFIYIDADHTAQMVYDDAIRSWPMLKTNGIMAFDDYLWGEDLEPELTPKPAIDKFLSEKSTELELLHQARQVWIKKTS